jgi:hypothetical protein
LVKNHIWKYKFVKIFVYFGYKSRNYKNYNLFLFKLKYPLLMVMPILCLQNGGNSPNKKHAITSLIFNFSFQKKWIRFIMIWKTELKIFQINLMLELFYVFKAGIVRIKFLNFYSLRVAFSLSNLWSQIYCCLHFSLNLHYFFFWFSSQKNLPSEEKSKPKKHVGGRWGVGVNPSI